MSVVLFAGPHADTKLKQLPSELIPASKTDEVVTAGEHVMNKINKTAVK